MNGVTSPSCQPPSELRKPRADLPAGQPLSLLLKQNPLVTKLSLYDVRGAPGVAADISHVNTASEVKGFEKDE